MNIPQRISSYLTYGIFFAVSGIQQINFLREEPDGLVKESVMSDQKSIVKKLSSFFVMLNYFYHIRKINYFASTWKYVC